MSVDTGEVSRGVSLGRKKGDLWSFHPGLDVDRTWREEVSSGLLFSFSFFPVEVCVVWDVAVGMEVWGGC